MLPFRLPASDEIVYVNPLTVTYVEKVPGGTTIRFAKDHSVTVGEPLDQVAERLALALRRS